VRRYTLLAGLFLLLVPMAASAAGGVIFNGNARARAGDSLEIEGRPVALMDIRAPRPDARCYEWRGKKQEAYDCGLASKAFLQSLLSGHEVSCVLEANVARCFANGRDVAEASVAAGWAVSCGQTGRYVLVQEAARRDRRGLWAGNHMVTCGQPMRQPSMPQ